MPSTKAQSALTNATVWAGFLATGVQGGVSKESPSMDFLDDLEDTAPLAKLAVVNTQAIAQRTTGNFGTEGDIQRVSAVLSVKTTNNSATELKQDGTGGSQRFFIASGRLVIGLIKITGVKSDGSAVAEYWRRFRIKNIAGTTSLVGSVETIGTDHEDNASCAVSVTADDTNDALKIEVTGITAETWRWGAHISGVEIAYGT